MIENVSETIIGHGRLTGFSNLCKHGFHMCLTEWRPIDNTQRNYAV